MRWVVRMIRRVICSAERLIAVEKAANGGWCISAGSAVPAAMEFISARAWRVLADRRADRNADKRRIAHPRIQGRAETAQAG
jgi:hypothetical protein